MNTLRMLAVVLDGLPDMQRSSDAKDKHILALAQAGGARYVVTGDKSGLLALRRHANAETVTAAVFFKRCLV